MRLLQRLECCLGILVVYLLSSCSSIANLGTGINVEFFNHFGILAGKKPLNLSLKQVHLSRDGYYQQKIVVFGQIVESSEHHTYLILDDEEARLLVVTTHLEAGLGEGIPVGTRIKVLGTLENGRLGMPYLKAEGLFQPKDGDKSKA